MTNDTKISGIANQVQTVLLYLMALVMPLHKSLVSPIIVLFILSSFFNLKKGKVWNYSYFLLLPYFLWHIIGLFWTENIPKGLFQLEIGMSLFLFPLVFMFSDLNLNLLWKGVKKYFIVGVLISIFISLSFATYNYIVTQDINWLFYSKLSIFHHPSYFAMYSCFALLLLYEDLLSKYKISLGFKRSVLFLFILIISIYCFLLLSKTGIILLVAVNLIGLFTFILKHYNLRTAIISSFALVILLFSSYFVVKPLQVRVDEAITSLSGEEKKESSTGARILVWESVNELIYQSPLIGQGTGDLKDALEKKYETKGYDKILAKSLNAHNQYLETLGKLGFIGLSFLLLLFSPLWLAIKSRDPIYILFVTLLLLNFLTESMLETQSGVVFFAFFNSLLSVSIIKRFYRD